MSVSLSHVRTTAPTSTHLASQFRTVRATHALASPRLNQHLSRSEMRSEGISRRYQPPRAAVCARTPQPRHARPPHAPPKRPDGSCDSDSPAHIGAHAPCASQARSNHTSPPALNKLHHTPLAAAAAAAAALPPSTGRRSGRRATREDALITARRPSPRWTATRLPSPLTCGRGGAIADRTTTVRRHRRRTRPRDATGP